MTHCLYWPTFVIDTVCESHAVFVIAHIIVDNWVLV